MMRIQQSAPPTSNDGPFLRIYRNPFYWSMCKGLAVFVGSVFLVRAICDEWDST